MLPIGSRAGIPRCPAQASSLRCPVPPTLNRAGHLPTTRPRGLNRRLHRTHHFLIPSLGMGRAGVTPHTHTSLSEGFYSESLKTPAQRRASEGGLGGGWRCRLKWWDHEFTSPATWHPPPTQRLQLSCGVRMLFLLSHPFLPRGILAQSHIPGGV